MADSENDVVYTVAPVDETRGRCAICDCRLQDPSVETGSIWLTPWHDCGGHCTVCMAHAEDPDAIAALQHWLDMTRIGAQENLSEQATLDDLFVPGTGCVVDQFSSRMCELGTKGCNVQHNDG